jgi:hypothetical protein
MKVQYLIIFLIMGVFIGESQAMSPKKGGAAPDLKIEGKACGGKKIAELKCIIKEQKLDWKYDGRCTAPKRQDLYLFDGEAAVKGGAIGITVDLYSKVLTNEKKIQNCLKYELDFIPDVQTLAGGKIFVRYPNIRYPLSIKVEFFGLGQTDTAKIGEQFFNIRLGQEDEKLFLAGKPSTKFGTETFIFPQPTIDISSQNMVFEAMPVGNVVGITVQLPTPGTR